MLKFRNLKFNHWIFLLWFVVLISNILLKGSSSVTLFDKNRILEDMIPSLENLTTRLDKKQGRPIVINFVRNNCRCNKYTLKHVERVKQLAEEKNYEYLNIHVNDEAELINLSAPSLAIFHNGNLSYIGPYAEGAMCSENSQFVENFLDRSYPAIDLGPTIFGSAIGCYCSD